MEANRTTAQPIREAGKKFDILSFSTISKIKMMNSKHNAPTTTTEELIVQYLDGELVRKELETVLFDRLSCSEEARMLLREYLVVRGAIRVSREDKRFQLSDDLDDRTRARIVQMMETLAAEELLVPSSALAEPVAMLGFIADRGAIASSPMSRQLKRWQIRGSFAALSLLLAFGAVWLFSGTSSDRGIANLQPLRSGAVPVTITQPSQNAGAAVTLGLTPTASLEKTHLMRHPRASRSTFASSSAMHSAQSNDPKVEEPTSASEATDPADVMISHRYTKAIDATKNEVVVTGKDRL